MAQTPSGVRRVPALLTGLATVVVALGALGAVGVLEPPGPAVAQASAGAAVTAPRVDGGSADALGTPDAVQPSSSGPIAELGQRLATSTESLIAVVNQPVADSATPAAVDPAKVPAVVAPAADPAAVPAESGSGRRVVYSLNAQRVWLVETDGRVNTSYAVSGRLDGPAPGSYKIYSMSPTAVSADGTLQLEHLLRFASADGAAVGFHDIPVRVADGTAVQTEAQLGEPLSGGSIRQSEADAVFLSTWAVLGTAVVVVA